MNNGYERGFVNFTEMTNFSNLELTLKPDFINTPNSFPLQFSNEKKKKKGTKKKKKLKIKFLY
jgi:hypothetical protein